ncbi:MAG: iron-only hydrogenase system regulator [Bacteroidales bacterium]|jgi:putative iron-only hydrogenase system regulator
MEKRIGTAIILVETKDSAARVNRVLSDHAACIIGRQGLPRPDGTSIISLVLEGTTDELGSLTGQLGRLQGLQVKSALLKNSTSNEKMV